MDIQLMFVVKYLRNSFERTHWEICSALIFSQTFASEKEEILLRQVLCHPNSWSFEENRRRDAGLSMLDIPEK